MNFFTMALQVMKSWVGIVTKILVLEILVLKILVSWTKIFTRKYGPPLEKPVWVENMHSGLFSQTGEYNITANQ